MTCRNNRRLRPLIVMLLAALTGCANLGGVQQPPFADLATTHGEELSSNQAVAIGLNLAVGQEKAGKDVAARDQYEKVLILDPDNRTATRRLAVLYDKCCDFAKADAAYKKLAKAMPKDADLFADWGYSYYLRNNWDEAEKQLRHALKLDPHNARAACNLGLALGQMGRADEAVQAFRDAGLSESEAHCDLAFVCWSQGKLDDARCQCAIARETDAACPKAQELLARLDPQAPRPAVPAGVVQAAYRKPTIAGPAAAPGTPVYRSPNGTSWVPVAPAADVPPRIAN